MVTDKLKEMAVALASGLRVAMIYDHLQRAETTGIYCLRGLAELARVSHFHPHTLDELRGNEFDLFLFIDDGLEYPHPTHLRPQAYWAIDTHMTFERIASKAVGADYVFAAQQDGAEQLAARLGREVEWVPLACDPNIHGRQNVNCGFDVCFVGNLSPAGHAVGQERVRLVRLLEREFASMHVGRHYFEEMARVYSASRIVFNRSLKTDVNMRVFEGLCSGSLLVTNDLSENGQADLFRDGVHLVTYGEEEELIDKVRFYLAHDDARHRIAAAGRREVLESHTYRQRMEGILKAVAQTTFPRSPSPHAKPPSAAGGRESRVVDPTYFEWPRPDLLALIPSDARRVLDIGCGAGRLGQALKARQECTVWGIELDETAAERAAQVLDHVSIGDIESMELDIPPISLDVIICGDILEHLRRPEELLRRAAEWLAPGGCFIASLPNVRHHSILAGLLAGNWTYEPAGLLDQTHLRFFTRREIEKLFFRAGYRIQRMQVVVSGASDNKLANSDRVGLGHFTVAGLSPGDHDELSAYQYLVVASVDRERNLGPGKTSIVMLTCNQLAYTRQCIASIAARTDEPYELIIVDNGSTDGTIEYLRRLEGVRVIFNAENRGFPAANNQGIRAAQGEQILLLNNDVIVTTGWLARLRMALYHEESIGLAGPYSNSVSGEQKISVDYDDLVNLDGFAWDWGQAHAGQVQPTDRLVGFCLLIKRAVVERIGVLDERFGLGNYEDDDFCRRALAAGFRAVIAQDAFVHHFGGVTYREVTDFSALLAENRRRYDEKWRMEEPTPLPIPQGTSACRFQLKAAEGPGLKLVSAEPRLSLCMIVRDSARTLEACLASIKPWVDEMVVVDTGSVDHTLQIAEQHGARLFHFPWCDDFAAARNESLRHATGEWLFWMDSDDTIDSANGERLRELAYRGHAPETLGYVLKVHCPHGSRDGGAEEDVTAVDHVKLIRNRPELRFEGRIHEQILSAINRLGGRVEWTDIFVVHSGTDHSREAQVRKLDRDLRLLKLEAEERPNHPFTLFNLGMTYLEMQQPSEALTYLERSLAVAAPHESHVPKAYSLLIQSLLDLGRQTEAWHRCAEGLKQYPEDPELLFRAGVLSQQFQRFDEAANYYRQVLKGGFETRFRSIDRGILGHKARHNLATTCAGQGRYDEAETLWREVLTERPADFDAWRGVLRALLARNQIAEAERLVGTDDLQSLPVVRLRLSAEADRYRQDFTAARAKLEEAVSLAPQDSGIRDDLCRLLFENGQPADAETALRELAVLRPDDSSVHHNLGQTYLRLDRPHEAIVQFREAIRLRPNAVEVWAHLAESLQQTGNTQEARTAWHHVAMIRSGDSADKFPPYAGGS